MESKCTKFHLHKLKVGGMLVLKFKTSAVNQMSAKGNQMLVRKFEFFDEATGTYSVTETDAKCSPKDIPNGPVGRFTRTWVGLAGAYRVAKLAVSTSSYLGTLLQKRGYVKLKNGEHK
jgi:hypothetical protein